MSESVRDDLSLSGVGSASGGVYGKVRLEGMASIHGDLDCVECNLDGMANVHGAIRAESIHIRGKTKVHGSIKAQRLTIDGDVLIDGNCIVSQKIMIHGRVKVNGSCEAELFEADGICDIDGLLNAERIYLRLQGSSSITDVGCTQIRVEKGSGRPLFRQRRLTVQHVEGDDIELCETVSRVVQGNIVSLGTGCVVERIEYRTDFHKHKNAKVTTVDQR